MGVVKYDDWVGYIVYGLGDKKYIVNSVDDMLASNSVCTVDKRTGRKQSYRMRWDYENRYKMVDPYYIVINKQRYYVKDWNLKKGVKRH
jgi:hypothetical protein